ncbi:MAG: helix-turn-helix domain-containing protein [Bacteroides sp.]|nr:helix-turn-helix domain-containing protein [Bacillota bacterium]MCM1456156.1 helix-turn-helix domain-containing protein [Bacteroides sp.]
MDIKVEVGKRLAFCRKQAGITQARAGAAIQMSQPNYARYERGVYELSYSQIITLCKLFDVSSDYLLGLADL